MDFTVERVEGVTVCRANEQLTINNRGVFKEKVLGRIAAGDRKFVFDFGPSDFIDSAGLGVLVTLSKGVREAGGKLILAGLNEDLMRLFEFTRLDTLFEIAANRDEALSAF